jgi:hypothetical protein
VRIVIICRSTSKIQVLKALKIEVEVFRIVTPCSVAVGYDHFGGPCCLHVQNEAARSWERLVSYRNTKWCRNPEDLDLKIEVYFSINIVTVMKSSKTRWEDM